MNLLILTNNPCRASFRQRIEIYLDILRQNGIVCEVAKLPSAYLDRWKLFKRGADFDAVFLQKKCLNFCDAFWLKRHSGRIIYDLDDAVMYSPQVPASNKTSHFKLFRRTAKLADMVIAGNSYLACGTFTLAKRVPDSDLLFEYDVYLKYFDTADEFFELAEWYLKNEQEREKIARAGMERAHSEFNCEKTAKHILDLIETGTYDAPWACVL